MLPVGAAAELRTLAECDYRFPSQTAADLRRLRGAFPDLRLYVDFYCFPNKEKRRLLYLAGTVPVHFEGSEYNIPVCIWLHETHPASRPRCYVCPSVSMVINPACPCVDADGNISLDALRKWTPGVSSLPLLVAEMRRAFQKDTPLYARCPGLAPPPSRAQVLPSAGGLQPPSPPLLPPLPPSPLPPPSLPLPPSPPPHSRHVTLSSSHLRGQTASQWEQSRPVRSYAEELQGIDFSAPPQATSSSRDLLLSSSPCPGAPPVLPLSRMVGELRLDEDNRNLQKPERIDQSEARITHKAAGEDPMKMAAGLPPDRSAIFLSLLSLEGRSFSPDDVMEAVQLSRDFPAALRFLTHRCPICQEEVTFSKMVTMTHCSCFLCRSCFAACFAVAIKEKSVEQLGCPQCHRPEVKGHRGVEEAMDYYNLLDTQIRHFLSPELHELYQRKLRDRALQEMPNFYWCSHCSFGMLHEADRLRMDCPSCKKSTCCQCRSPWSPQHQGLSCQQFRVWQQQNDAQQSPPTPPLISSSIKCPCCQSVFSLSRGGCLHFTCSQCQHQFCGGCSQTFSPGPACGFSADCAARGLHAHHPRDCLYHLRDWSLDRLTLLLQHCRVRPAWMEPDPSPETGPTGVCLVPEMRDDGSRREEPCGRPAEHRGYCQQHYKEHLVEVINGCRADPAHLFSPAEMVAELQRWNVAVPTRRPDEPEPLYARRLHLTLTNRIPLRKQQHLTDDVTPKAPPPHLLTD